MSKGDKHREIVHIVLDKRCNIEYTSIDNQNAISYIEKLKILQRLSDDLPIQYDLGDCYVNLDKVNIANKVYYLITIIEEYDKCTDCSRVFIDKVTGLYNRNYWERLINDEMSNLVAENFTLIIIDVDNLKGINDIYGHTAGDKVIEIVGEGIKKCIRKSDVGLRYGGDEFIILLFKQDRNIAYKVIERIRGEIHRLSVSYGLNIQFSAGIAYSNSLKNMADTMTMADKDLYREKGLKNR
ncbi:GGDEF domain-containing protein [Tissierella sp. MB52-C2]|uniref:GGDEF domain-containing protein n=1 Tax=Tissierella sp. MB52-C2 TaxID=3070999 RepID=UPI00280B9E68|nr:GGDEF domain-containing protein [Tissierella sp. MB52-C2]WMM24543.1 GGDEF domain-containing protein [Tissierella sp. MB52-C2]